MKLKSLILLLFIYPVYSYGECDVLGHPFYPYYVKSPEASSLDVEYNRIIFEYVEKYNNNYRSESYFKRLLKSIEYRNAKNINKLQGNDRLFYELSEYYHFDESISDSLMRLAEKRHLASFYCLGFVYERGIGQEIDYAKSWAWFYVTSSVDGLSARKNLNRVWRHLDVNAEVRAKGLADKYIRFYTDFNETPSTVIIK